jgi:hypothetical protein
MSKWKIALAVGGAVLAAASVAWAGEAVYGYGSSRAEAAADANYKADRAAAQRFPGRHGCTTPVRPDSCRQDGSGWVCVAYVANHEGSCE